MRQDRRLAAGLVVAGLVGLVASAVLLIERIRVGEDSDYVPTCSINPIISCGSIMESAQASLLGFPNPIIGAWLVFQSLYRIGALCPYCMVVWVVVIPTFWYVTLRNLASGVFGQKAASARGTTVMWEWHAPVLLSAYLLVIVLITVRFWSYWVTLL